MKKFLAALALCLLLPANIPADPPYCEECGGGGSGCQQLGFVQEQLPAAGTQHGTYLAYVSSTTTDITFDLMAKDWSTVSGPDDSHGMTYWFGPNMELVGSSTTGSWILANSGISGQVIVRVHPDPNTQAAQPGAIQIYWTRAHCEYFCNGGIPPFITTPVKIVRFTMRRLGGECVNIQPPVPIYRPATLPVYVDDQTPTTCHDYLNDIHRCDLVTANSWARSGWVVELP